MTRIKLILATLGVVALIAAASGCGKSDPKNMSKEQLLEKTKEMMTKMADAIKSNKGNCDAMGQALQKISDEAKGLKARSDELEKDPETKKWMDEQGEKMKEEAGKMMGEVGPIITECIANEGVKKAMEGFGG